MGAEANVATIRGIVDALNRRALDEITPNIASGFVRHDLGSFFPDVREAEGVRDFLSTLIAAVPDLRLDIEQIWGTDDRVAMILRFRGTHTGTELLGVEPAGAWLDYRGINLYRFEGGKIAETWQLADGATFFRQLGVLT